MKNQYDPKTIEAKWVKIWDEKKTFQVDIKNAKKPFYNLAMFPYPSGEGLHVGHIVPYSGVDTFGRYKRMKGFDVFEPMGFDSFGIHSENYAIKVGKHPRELTEETIKYFRDKQMKRLGTLFDWDHQVATSDSDYYKWTQWIFIQMFKYGLAEKKTSFVTYCPSCKTVLSDEQTETKEGVVVCERCKTPIEQKEMKQWFFKITKYAEKLLSNLSKIDWSQRTKNAQREWIGKSEGVLVTYKVKDLDIHFSMFDSVPQTYMAQTFTVIAPEHPQLYELVKGTEYEKPVMEFAEKIKKKRANKQYEKEKEMEGIFTGRYIEYTPAKKLIPLWVSSFVIAEYGTGVVNASAHDERDFALAKKYNLPLHPVMFPKDPKEAEKVRNLDYCYNHADEGIITEPAEFKGRKWGEARNDIINYIESQGWGKRTAQFHLRDWTISRQRYWGPPIPMVYCSDCMRNGITYFDMVEKEGNVKNPPSPRLRRTREDFENMPGWFSVREEELPILLPETKDYLPDGSGKSPLARISSFAHTTCPFCGGVADRETDVSDTFLDSSWYHLRYPSVGEDEVRAEVGKSFSASSNRSATSASTQRTLEKALPPRTSEFPWDPIITKKWLPVDMYIGGQEHAVLHLMYARFVAMALHDMGYISFDEPYTRFFAHGLMIKEGVKMSKSRGNVVNPLKYLDLYGSDCLRLYVLFMGPYDQKMDFRDSGIDGMYRFLGRVYSFVQQAIESKNKEEDTSLIQLLSKKTKIIGEDIEKLHFNTSIAHLMEILNAFSDKKEGVSLNMVKQYITLLAPFAPFISEEMWQMISSKCKMQNAKLKLKIQNEENFQNGFRSVHQQSWPEFDEKHLQEETVTVVAQINGKVRDMMTVLFEKGKNQEEMEREFKKSEKIKKYLEGKKIIKTIFIPGKVVNFVVE